MTVEILVGDCRDMLRTLSDGVAQTCVTSPPYFGLRDYGVDGQIGLESSPAAFVATLVDVFREVRRVLADDGTLWLNLGDTYAQDRGGTSPPAQSVAGGIGGKGGEKERRGMRDGYNPSRDAKAHGLKHKDLMMIPARVAIALQADGWWLRSHIIWHKPNPMPESVTDRPTSAHESIFLLSKSAKYFYDADGGKEAALQPIGEPKLTAQRKANAGGFTTNGTGNSTLGSNQGEAFRNLRNVWTIATQPFSGAHFATFPPALVEPCIKAGSRPGDTVLDPFGGAGTTGLVADRLGRNAILTELNPAYASIARERIAADAPLLARVLA